ncbi:MAG: hypothetical protein Satyrvirus43_9 [Satyrvirus sp.]|uniref:Uncharacterized protein n=1 Tax=Satyrvirus sp. TaxID=2487771 RepID=A0A3G5AF12_9VIRU|nr:MAG: hypothetical protein Satyrvirus43_9 [Satyrvirus sp.]
MRLEINKMKLSDYYQFKQKQFAVMREEERLKKEIEDKKSFKQKTKEMLIQKIDKGCTFFVYRTIHEGDDYEFLGGKVKIIKPELIEIINLLEEENLRYKIKIEDHADYGCRVDNKYGEFIIYFNQESDDFDNCMAPNVRAHTRKICK